MPLFIREDSKKLKNRQITIPDAVAKKLYQNMNMYAKDKTSNGYKRLKALTDKSYNKRSEKKDNQHNNNMTVSFGDARRIVHDMSHMPQTPKNKEFNMIGGYDTLYALKNGLKQARSSVKQVKQVPEVPKLEKNPTKTPDVKDSIKMGSANITITENLEDFYEDYYYEYGVYSILNDFLKNPNEKQDWGVLINPYQYKKALSEFTRFGRLTSFPKQKVYQWMGIIMRNTAKLIGNTELVGHSESGPLDDCVEFFERYLGDRFIGIDYKINGLKYYVDERFLKNECKARFIDISNIKDIEEIIRIYNEKMEIRDSRFSLENGKIVFSEDYLDFFDRTGIYDTMILPDGSDAYSDYGLEPLMNIIKDYDENLSAEEVLVLVNKCLDVYHRRGDLASAFIEGGSKSLTAISEEVNKLNGRKTLYITEKQMKVIKEYHNQLKIPFNDPSKPYDLKANYEHLIDFFEAIGKYGKLPSVKVNMNNPSKYIYQYISDFIYGNTEWVESYDFNSIQLFIDFIQEYYNVDKFFAPDAYSLNQIRELCLNKEIDVDDLVDCGLISEDDIEEYERNLDPFNLLSNNGLLTDEGVETYKNEFLIPQIKDYLDDHFYNIETDSRGLIRIEREIHIPNINATWVNNEKNVTHYSNNYYTELMKKYDGIGVCWSYLRGGAEAYCGSSFGSGTSSAIIVGYVSPDDVNWVDTICLNFNNYEEYELRLNEGAVVEINEVLVKPIGNSKNVEKMHLPIRNTILVKA